MLEELGRGVGRLKNQSTMINEETSLHVRLLDDMEGDAERASSGLRAEARHAEKVKNKCDLRPLKRVLFVLPEPTPFPRKKDLYIFCQVLLYCFTLLSTALVVSLW